jgi:adenylate cyclase
MLPESLSIELAAHVPKWVSSYLRRVEADSPLPAIEERQVALLQLDIAGFSATTDRLSGRRAEELNLLIGDCFGVLSDVLEAHGGDILAFAGDAILSMWDIDDAREAAARAAHCGLELCEVMRSWGVEHGNIGHRTAIEFGPVHFCRMGGHAGRWHYFVVGEPIARMGVAYRCAAVGDVSLCTQAASALDGLCEGEPTVYGLRLLQLRSPFSPKRSEPINFLPKSLEVVLPRVVRERMEFGRGTWAGEFRALTIVRVVRRGMTFEREFPQALHSLIRETQAVVDVLEGVVHQVLMDDKGLNLTAIFGLPRLAHEDDPLRAVEAAMSICQRMHAIGMEVSVGVATGGLFCGAYGGKARREYGVFGQAINLAALLAEAARGGVVCDAATAQAVGSQIAFSLLPHVYGKGGETATMAFSPRGRVEKVEERQAVVGRDNERARLRDCLDEAVRGQGSLVLVSGEAGIGKSRILMDMISTAEARGLVVLQGLATAINVRTAYFVWRQVLAQVLSHAPESGPALLLTRLEEAFSDTPTQLSWLPLLETVIPLGLVETALTEQITGAARAAAIEDLVVALLARGARPAVLVLEDLHWFDSSSVDLLAAVARRVPRLLIVVSDRTGPVSGAVPDRRRRLAADSEIGLQALSRDAIEQIMRRRLQVAEIPPELGAFIHRHAGGNPFYSDELVLALRDTGHIQVVRGVCKVDQILPGVALTDNLDRAILSRIDVLSEEDQFVLKVASAIGDEFKLDMLASIVPDDATGASVESVGPAVVRLVDSDFLILRQAADGARFDFRHALTREATYSLLSQAQRRSLHRAIAQFIEASNASHLQPFHARLARHWEQASDTVRALHYLELAAQHALLNYSNRDAIRYVDEMMVIARRTGMAIADDRAAMWEIISGDAHHELSEYELSSGCYRQAMMLLGQQLPATIPARLRALVRNCVRQVVNRIRVARGGSLTAVQRLAVQRASHIYEFLSEQYFFLNDSLAVLNGTLASLNLAEQCEATPEMIRGFAALSLGLGMSGLVGPARSYSRRAHELAQRQGSLPDLARVLLVSGVLEYGLGEWDVVRERSERAVALYRQLGDRPRAQTSQVMAAFAALLSGDVERVERIDATLAAELSGESSAQVRVWHYSVRLLLGLPRGHVDAGDIAALKALAEARLIRTDRLLCLGVMAKACEHCNDTERAAEIAVQALQIVDECNSVWGGYAYGPAAVADVLIARWEASRGDDCLGTGVRDRAEACVRQLSRLARTSPICRPFAWLACGRVSIVTHRVGAARRSFQRAAAVAGRLRMPYEQAHAYRRLGTTFDPGDPNRMLHLRHAEELYRGLGATADLAHVQQGLAREPGADIG